MLNLIQSILLLTAVLESLKGEEEVVYAQVQDTVILKPPMMYDSTEHYLYWHFGDTTSPRLAWRNHFGGSGTVAKSDTRWGNISLSGGSLMIKNIRQEHFGTFVCTLGQGKPTVTYKLLKLTITKSPASPFVPGELLSLHCSAETPQDYKKPEIHWLNPQGEKKETNQGGLNVKVTGQDDGQWTCVVTNNERESKAKISVTVVDLSAPLHPQYTSESSPLNVPCSFPSHISWDQIKAVGIQEVSWHFQSKLGSNVISNDPQRLCDLTLGDPSKWKKVQDRDLTPIFHSKRRLLALTRTLGREEDRGDYVCSMKARNGVTLNRIVHVKVLQITSAPGTELISGQQVNLTCSLGEPLPSGLRLKWVPPEQSSLTSLTPDHQPAHLTIPQVGEGYGGRWRCELWQNDTMLMSAVITLKIEPKLSVWMLVIICSVPVIIIFLLIFIVIIYKRRQRKTTHLRHRLCKCKNPKPKGFYRT
ncbi:CD4-1 molecule [Notolabrus celidotus]|uniref:CD4-1 molecule n=1 Tax=Notolabrus celidotus TaxID=1203425 RepID=UPI00148F4E54|nr:CD4-1 molecule [Notolabrus celidotus]